MFLRKFVFVCFFASFSSLSFASSEDLGEMTHEEGKEEEVEEKFHESVVHDDSDDSDEPDEVKCGYVILAFIGLFYKAISGCNVE